jgi:hypothetical protein
MRVSLLVDCIRCAVVLQIVEAVQAVGAVQQMKVCQQYSVKKQAIKQALA